MGGLRMDAASVLSVVDLVRGRLSATDSWNLATVQRIEARVEVRLCHLLDSASHDTASR